jgi:hypothetical protein
VQAVQTNHVALSLVPLFDRSGSKDSISPVLVGYMHLFEKSEFNDLLSLINTSSKKLPCHPCWLHLLSAMCHDGLKNTSQFNNSYAAFLNSLPIASPSSGLIVHWDKLTRACSPRAKNRELQEIRRYRKLMLGTFPTNSSLCILCASTKSPYVLSLSFHLFRILVDESRPLRSPPLLLSINPPRDNPNLSRHKSNHILRSR